MRHRRALQSLPSFAAAASLFAAGALSAPVAASAGLPSPLRVHREIHEHLRDVRADVHQVGGAVHDLLRQLDRVPQRLERRHRQHLEVFFGGHEYYRPHRHEHRVYRFPVWIDGVVAYRPYTYCDDHLFADRGPRPRFWADWRYDRQGGWCDRCRGRYPSSHSCFQSRGGTRDHRSYDRPRYDRRDGGRGHDRYDQRQQHRHDKYCDHDRRDDRRRRRDHDDD
jgi:hypothetical protein